ncbi:hypothetical protein GCM10027445_60570 [Amycolatopsis endophytica]|uniref:Uncharacterized protein n=1 Tax=Amycolatopsis endophytica TaxID=860233 RepID=A0A853AZN1_9PSEU|nr:hypothetical protein [Amycolatopsis endophytica]NYI88190.1 hypothetical protein [Amycolatopsis endophytica]
MARTILRDRSGELVRSVQLADRTGIVAASAPQPARSQGDGEMGVLDFAVASGQLDVALAAGLSEAAVVGEERQVLRQVRRNLMVAGAAVVLVVLGWIGGNTFGFEHESGSVPAVAAGPVPTPVPAAPTEPAPSSTVTPQAAAPSPKPLSAPVTTKATQPTRKKTEVAAPTTPSKGGEARAETVEETPSRQDRSSLSLNERLQQLIETWSWARTNQPGDFGDEQDRSIRSFGPLGD